MKFVVWCCTVLWCVVWCCVVPCFAVLCCVVLCVVVCCVGLCCCVLHVCVCFEGTSLWLGRETKSIIAVFSRELVCGWFEGTNTFASVFLREPFMVGKGNNEYKHCFVEGTCMWLD